MVSTVLTLSSNAGDEMLQISENSVQCAEQSKISDFLDKINWHDLNMLRHVADASSLRKAGLALGVSVNTIRARLDRLEAALGTILFARSRHGLQITAEGRAVLQISQEMRLLGAALPGGRGNHVLVTGGEVRVCASEGVGTFWLTPRLPALKLALADHLVTLDCCSDQQRVSLDGYDVAVGFQKPMGLEVVCARIATLHVLLFASDQYLRQHGSPTSFDDIEGHSFVQQESPGLNPHSIACFLSEEAIRKLVSYKFNSSFSHYWAVVTGLGIGAMPTYARIITRRVRPVEIPFQMRFDLWMSYRREARQSQPVRKVVEWLRDSFDPQRYPWFANHFIHPNEFAATHEDSLVVPLFDQLTGGD